MLNKTISIYLSVYLWVKDCGVELIPVKHVDGRGSASNPYMSCVGEGKWGEERWGEEMWREGKWGEGKWGEGKWGEGKGSEDREARAILK